MLHGGSSSKVKPTTWKTPQLIYHRQASLKVETATYDEVKTALDKHYEGRRNVIVERARFYRRKRIH